MVNKMKFKNKGDIKSPKVSAEENFDEYEEPKKWFHEALNILNFSSLFYKLFFNFRSRKIQKCFLNPLNRN